MELVPWKTMGCQGIMWTSIEYRNFPLSSVVDDVRGNFEHILDPSLGFRTWRWACWFDYVGWVF